MFNQNVIKLENVRNLIATQGIYLYCIEVKTTVKLNVSGFRDICHTAFHFKKFVRILLFRINIIHGLEAVVCLTF